MKTKLFSLMLIGVLFSYTTKAQNLIQGGNMEDGTLWTEQGTSSFSTNANTRLAWNATDRGTGNTQASAGFGTDGYLAVCEGWKAGAQYSISQAIDLTAGISYTFGFDYEIKANSNSWFEIYIGKTPHTDAEYTDNKIAALTGVKISRFSYDFTPEETDTYYFVIKMGCGWTGTNGYFRNFIDNVSVKESDPTAAFSVKGFTIDFAPMVVEMENKSLNATSYAWDFGDGVTGTDARPAAHTYATPGTYTITLVVDGDEDHPATQTIHVLETPDPDATEKLVGGDMEDESKWFTAVYRTGNANPDLLTVNWNYSKADNPGNFPSGGDGKALAIKDDVGNASGMGNRYRYIYRPVSLKAGFAYSFDMAARSIREANTGTLWVDYYILKEQPFDGKDLSVTNASSPGYYSGAAPGYGTPETTWDVMFSNVATKGANYAGEKCIFVPEETGTYFLILKIGTSNRMEIAIDNLSLTEILPDAVAGFDLKGFTVGLAPFTVEFENKTLYRRDNTVYAWDFGDGTGTSTEENPSYAFTEAGTYAVSLTVNGNTENQVTRTIHVVAGSEEEELLLGGDMEDAEGTGWFVSRLNGQTKPVLTWGYGEEGSLPSEGEGKALRIRGEAGDGANNAYRKNFCIYQPVALTAGKTYRFDMAIRALDGVAAGLWIEAYLENFEQPSEDYVPGGNTNLSFAKENIIPGCMGYIPTGTNIAGIDALFGTLPGVIIYEKPENETNPDRDSYPFDKLTYVPETTGMYYFILKIGGNNGSANLLDIVIDNLSLKEAPVLTTVSVIDNFVIEGEEIALEITATDQWENPIEAEIIRVVSDPEEGVTIENREGVYYATGVEEGVYTLTATAVSGKNSITGTGILTVTRFVSLNNPAAGKPGIYPNPATGEIRIQGKMNRITLYSSQGQAVLSKTNTNALDVSSLAKGLYIVNVDGQISKVIIK